MTSLLEKYRSTPGETSNSLLQKYKTSPYEEMQSSNTEFPFEGENDLDREIERNIAQQTSRMGESILGAPGDIWSFAKSIFGFEPETNLPTSQSLREASEKYSLGYTKPQNEFEEKLGETQQDISSFLLPGSKQYSMFRNIGIPIAANLAKEGINYLGSEKLGVAAKAGLMVGLDLIANRYGMGGGAKKYASGIFDKMDKRIQKGRSVNALEYKDDLINLRKDFLKGGSSPSVKPAIEKIDEILKEIKPNGKIDLEYLAKTRPKINEIIEDLGGFEYLFKPKMKEKIVNNLSRLKSENIKAIENYAKYNDPELLQLSRSANEAWSAYENSNKIGKFLNHHFGNKALGKSVQTLLGIGAPIAGSMISNPLITGGLAMPTWAGYQGIKILSRVKNSPTLRKYYGNIIKGSLSGNVGQVSRNLRALDKELEKED